MLRLIPWEPKWCIFVMTLQSLAQLASNLGVRMYEGTQVNRVTTCLDSPSPRVDTVETDRGVIKCDYFINCGGFWARSLGKKTQPPVKVPVQAVEHYYLHTKKVHVAW